MPDQLKSWLDKHSALTHYVAAAIAGLSAAYLGFPPFHDLVSKWYGHVPADAKVLIQTGAFLYGWYRNGQAAQ